MKARLSVGRAKYCASSTTRICRCRRAYRATEGASARQLPQNGWNATTSVRLPRTCFRNRVTSRFASGPASTGTADAARSSMTRGTTRFRPTWCQELGQEESLPAGGLGLDVAEAAKPLLAARVFPDLSPAGATFLAPSTRSLEQHTNPFAHRWQERCALFEAVPVAEDSQPFRLSADRVAESLARLVVVQRDETVGGPCEIPKWRCRRGEIPVDQRARNSAAFVDGVVRR